LSRKASRYVSLQQADDAITRAFATWTRTICAAGSCPSVQARDLGPVDCDRAEYDPDSGNQNVVIFRDDSWPYHDVNNALALTTVTFDAISGEIFDADTEVNSYQYPLAVRDPIPFEGYDLESIVTHEMGHFLGLAHSGDTRATMFARYEPGSTTKRNLAADDREGICTIYPPGGQRSVADGQFLQAGACDPTPHRGFSSRCAEEPTRTPNCAITPLWRRGGAIRAPAQDRRLGAALGLALAALVLRRRARARIRPHSHRPSGCAKWGAR
jgi:hypothetical protein